MKRKNKSIALLATTALLGIGCGAAAVGLSIYASTATETVVDSSVLYIGVPAEYEGSPLTLSLKVRSANGSEEKDYLSTDLSPMGTQGEELVFLDYASTPLIALNEDVGYWISSEDNSILASVTCNEVITSAEVNIDKAGIWLLNAPVQAGSKPNVVHKDCYVTQAKTLFGGD